MLILFYLSHKIKLWKLQYTYSSQSDQCRPIQTAFNMAKLAVNQNNYLSEYIQCTIKVQRACYFLDVVNNVMDQLMWP